MIMKKDVQLKFALLLMLFVASFAACDDDDEKIDAGSPDFTFNSETGEYNVRIGKEVALCARVKDAVNPVYTWKRSIPQRSTAGPSLRSFPPSRRKRWKNPCGA